jgi:hydroxyethylthiazole kinase
VRPGHWLAEVRRLCPLVHHLTSPVTAYAVAAATAALGASPVLAEDPDDAAAMAGEAAAVVANLGMPRPYRLAAMRQAASARRPGVPLVLDPVGAGATAARTRTARDLLAALRPSVVRCNAAEAGALAGAGGRPRGIDAAEPPDDVAAVALALAAAAGTVVAVTGAVDVVAAPSGRLARCRNGHRLATRLVGAGCMATAVVGAFAAVCPDPWEATAAALACFGLACTRAAARSAGPGSLLPALLDELATLEPPALDAGARIEVR